MKKTFLTLFFFFFLISSAFAEIGLNLGVSGQIGEMSTSGKEVNTEMSTTETSQTEKHLFATAGFFVEKDFAFLPKIGDSIGSRIAIGYDNIGHDIGLGTTTNVREASLGAAGAAVTGQQNSLSAKVVGFETYYLTVNLTDWLYVKVGDVTVDLNTKFEQGGVAQTGYGNSHTLDGSVFGIGLEKSTDNGFFARLEYNDYDIDGKTVTNTGTDSKFTATLNSVTGDTTRISLGKSF